MNSKTLGVNYYGFFKGVFGISEATRLNALALEKNNIPISYKNYTYNGFKRDDVFHEFNDNNNDFDIVSYPGLGFVITSKVGVVIPAGSNLKIGYNVDASGINSNSGDMVIILGEGTGGTVTIVGDSNSANNKGSKTYSISN